MQIYSVFSDILPKQKITQILWHP